MPYYTHIRYKDVLDNDKKPYVIQGNLIEVGINNLIEIGINNSYEHFNYLKDRGIPFIHNYWGYSHATWVHHNPDGSIQYDHPDMTNVSDVLKYIEELFTEEILHNAALYSLRNLVGLHD